MIVAFRFVITLVAGREAVRGIGGANAVVGRAAACTATANAAAAAATTATTAASRLGRGSFRCQRLTRLRRQIEIYFTLTRCQRQMPYGQFTVCRIAQPDHA